MQRNRWRVVVGTVLLLAALAAGGYAFDAARVGHQAQAAALAFAALGAFLTLWLLFLSVHLVENPAAQ